MNTFNSKNELRPAFLTDMRGLGGGETSLLNLLSALKKNGLRPVLFCPDGSLFREALNLGIDIYSLEYPDVHLKASLIPTFSIKTVIRIAGLFRKYRINIVHIESLLGLYYGGMAARLCRIPLVATYHGYWPVNVLHNRYFLRMFCRRIYPVSDAICDEIKPVFQDRAGDVVTVPLGVHQAFLEILPGRDEARHQLGMPLGRWVILQVARFQPIKGHHHLLNALSLLIDEMGEKAPLLLFVGGVLEPPSKEELEYKAKIENISSGPKFQNHVRLLGHRKDIPLLIRAADITVCPSDFESFGMAIIESMIVGTPIVTTCSGGPGELIEHGKTGLLIQPGDHMSLADSIRQLFNNPDQRNRMAEAAQTIARARYGPDSRCEILLNEYRELI
jgi:glycosyltransferase involved in cell wall biosynthesis